MIQLRSYPRFFKSLKILQLLLSFVIFIIEMIQIEIYCAYISENNLPIPKSSFFLKQDFYNGEVKIWYYIVIIVTLIGIGYYLSRFHKYWGMGPNIIIDLIFFLLWFVAGLANLSPVYSGSDLSCPLIQSNLDSTQNLKLHCLYYIITLTLGWINTFLFLTTSVICHIIKREKIKWDEEKSGLSRKSKDYKSYDPMDSRSNLNPA
ncbi:unnamed protein product [Rhizophagus irregularis]|nr:unnamed protein product [Rhizophagus irregularis]